MRATVRGLLVGNGALTTLIPTERWYQAGAVHDSPRMPFGVLRWIAPVRGDARGTFTKQLQVQVFDQRGDYTKIDAVLKLVLATLEPVEDFTGVDGHIAQLDYLGDSGDQEDTDLRAGMKYSSWQIAGRSFT